MESNQANMLHEPSLDNDHSCIFGTQGSRLKLSYFTRATCSLFSERRSWGIIIGHSNNKTRNELNALK